MYILCIMYIMNTSLYANMHAHMIYVHSNVYMLYVHLSSNTMVSFLAEANIHVGLCVFMQ